MTPCDLRLEALGHCYVHLPAHFVSKESVKQSAVVRLISVQSDKELVTVWNGRTTDDNKIHLDITFGRANGFQDELVVLSIVNDRNPVDCINCQAELVEASDYTLLSQHVTADVLDRCRIVYKDLIIPIWLSEHVSLIVKIVRHEPLQDLVSLTKFTQMQFSHSVNQQDIQSDPIPEDIRNPIPYVSFSLGIDYKPKIYPRAMLICGDRGSGKTYHLEDIVRRYKRFRSNILDCKQLRAKRVETIKKILLEEFQKALAEQPYIIGLDDIDSLVSIEPKHHEEKTPETLYRMRLVDVVCRLLKLAECTYHSEGRCVLFIVTCRSFKSFDSRLRSSNGGQYFGSVLKLEEPDLNRRSEILKSILVSEKEIKTDLTDDQIELVSRRCNTFMPIDLKRLIERSTIIACSRSRSEFDPMPVRLQLDDLTSALENYVPTNLRGVALKPKTERTFETVGGMRPIKEALQKIVLLPIKYPNLFRRSPIRPQTSILLYGPPGCGKTMIAEALTNQAEINSICIRGPELLSKYIGASEGAVRDLFKRAQSVKPCIIFFDEFESLVARRGSDSTGVTDRVVNQFLTLMDGVEQSTKGVFIIAASSRPDIIDPAILRPGRIDRHIYCPIPDKSDRLEILNILCRRMKLRGVDLDVWSEKLDRFTGADIQALLYSAQVKALHEMIEASKEEETKLGAKNNVEFTIEVSERHLLSSYMEVSEQIRDKYETLLSEYPKSLKKSANKISTRATLA